MVEFINSQATSEAAILQLRPKGNLPFLDGLRGFAALWVLAAHCAQLSGWYSVPLLNQGPLAVDIFMIMSGFLMAYHYYRREHIEPWTSPKSWLRFYTRRFFRIAPLYYLLLIPSLLFSDQLLSTREAIQAVFAPPWAASYAHDPTIYAVTPLSVFLHFSFLFGLLPQYASSTTIRDWSISLEVQFYLFFPFIMLFIRRFAYFWPALALGGLSVIANKLFAVYISSPPGPLGVFPQPSLLALKLPLFVIGILLAAADHYREIRSSYLYLALLAMLIASGQAMPVIAVVLVVSLILFYDREEDPFRLSRVLRSIERFLGNRISALMADLSYSVYLLHFLLLLPLAFGLLQLPVYPSLVAPLRFLALFAVVALPTYGLSWLLFQLIEKPGIQLGKALLRLTAVSSRS